MKEARKGRKEARKGTFVSHYVFGIRDPQTLKNVGGGADSQQEVLSQTYFLFERKTELEEGGPLLSVPLRGWGGGGHQHARTPFPVSSFLVGSCLIKT